MEQIPPKETDRSDRSCRLSVELLSLQVAVVKAQDSFSCSKRRSSFRSKTKEIVVFA